MAVTLTYTIAAAGAQPVATPITQVDRLYGRDIYFDVTQNSSDADYHVGPAGDWIMVEGREALRQALTRRLITNPGEWQTLPEYGAGCRLFVKARNTPSMRAELEERIRGNLAQEPRVRSVAQVIIEQLENGPGLKISVVVIPTGEPQRAKPLTATVEVS